MLNNVKLMKELGKYLNEVKSVVETLLFRPDLKSGSTKSTFPANRPQNRRG